METGLLLLTYRYFDPVTGRFLTRDPIGVEGEVNLYAYVGNGVVNRIDPEGLCIKIGNDCYGFDCHGDPDCPPAKKPKPKPKPAPPVYPPQPPVPVPFPYQLPYTPSPGTPPVQGSCEAICAALLCPGKYSFVVCAQWCRWLCQQQCNPNIVGPAPGRCHSLPFNQCLNCCEKAFPDAPAARNLCQYGCQ